jgi:NAD(P)-dependent dehydrogenase (short-subunit alcohol dehydrogenase family)
VVGFTKTLAVELGDEGIRVNAICPGAVDGPRIRRVIDDKAAMLGRPGEGITDLYLNQSSLRRFVTVDDVAATVLFLIGPGGRMITGQALAVDGNTEKLY